MQEIISAIDVGTTKICALMAGVVYDSLGNLALRALGEGQVASRGIRRGVVFDVGQVTAAIGEAVEACEQRAGREMTSSYVGIAGSHVTTLNSQGVAPADRTHGILGADMQRALEGASAVALPENQQVIHTIARRWTVDNQPDVYQPLGMSAYRLEVDAHIVTGSSTAIRNLVGCVAENGIDVDELVLEPLASSEAVLEADERRMGVALVDIGGGTTDLAVFIDGALCHTEILDLGGNHFTNDVAIGLHAPFETAEELKQRYGHVQPERIAEDENVWASVFGDRSERSFSRYFISQILEARAVEVSEIIHDRLVQAGFYHRLPAGIVLTGGASQLPGLAELMRNELSLPVRVGAPQAEGGNAPVRGLSRAVQSPAYATSVGLLLWALREDARALHFGYSHVDHLHGHPRRQPTGAGGSLAGIDSGEIVGQVRDWLRHLLPG